MVLPGLWNAAGLEARLLPEVRLLAEPGMIVRTRYGLASWWRAVQWWWPRRRRQAVRVACCSLPKAAYYQLRGGRIVRGQG